MPIEKNSRNLFGGDSPAHAGLVGILDLGFRIGGRLLVKTNRLQVPDQVLKLGNTLIATRVNLITDVDLVFLGRRRNWIIRASRPCGNENPQDRDRKELLWLNVSRHRALAFR